MVGTNNAINETDPAHDKARPGLIETRAFMVFAILALRVLLDLSYYYLVAPVFEHAGYGLDINERHLAWSYALLLAWAVILPVKRATPSGTLFSILFVMCYLPLSSLFAMRNDALQFFVLSNVFLFTLLATMTLLPRMHIESRINAGPRIFIALTITLFALVAVVATQRGLLSHATLSIYEIYDVRETIQTEVFPGLLGYAASWLGKVLIPALLIVGFYTRSVAISALALGLSIVAYGGTTAKEMLFYPFVAALVYVADRGRQLIPLFVAAICGAILLSFATSSEDGSLISALLVHRSLFAPANLNYQYFYFFSENPHTYWSNAFLGGLMQNPYDEPVALIIGRDSWGPGTQTFANVGVIGSAYMHFGVPGIFFFPIIIGIVFWLIDALVRDRMPRHVGTAIATPAVLQFTNGDLSATLLSHGLGIACVALFLLGSLDRTSRSATDSAPERLPGTAPT